MAIVANKANGQIDKSYCTFNRSGAGTPVATITPQYAGERYLDTTNNKVWQAETLVNTGWVQVNLNNMAGA